MKTVFLLVAKGPNRIEIPCLWFKSREEFNSFSDRHKLEIKDDWVVGINGGQRVDDAMKNGVVSSMFFKFYYDGGGEVHSFKLREVESGTPFVQWDLD